RVILDVLLERAPAVRSIVAQDGVGHEVKAEGFTDQVSGHFAPRQAVLGEIPQWLFAARRLVDRWIDAALMPHVHEKGVIAAEHKLPFQLDLAELEGSL